MKLFPFLCLEFFGFYASCRFLQGCLYNIIFTKINAFQEVFDLPTDLEKEFINNKILSNFENVKLYSVFYLPTLIKDLKNAGFHYQKFEVYFNNLLAKPILFFAVILIGCYFGINNFRSQRSALMISLGMAFGLGLYIILNFVAALGSSRYLPSFGASWVITLSCLALGILMIYSKDNV